MKQITLNLWNIIYKENYILIINRKYKRVTLYAPRLSIVHLSVASLPTVAVVFGIGSAKEGIKGTFVEYAEKEK